jgi:hypothetical protein
LPLIAAVTLVACGQSGPPTACKKVGDARVEQATKVRALSSTLDESPGLSVCHWTGGGASVRVTIDAAPQAPLRYFHRITEQYEFHSGDPHREPRLVYDVGDDARASGGAGAYWVEANGQLIAQRGDRLVIVTLHAPEVPAEKARKAATGLALAALEGAGGKRGGAPATDRQANLFAVITPGSGAAVHDSRVEVAGTAAKGVRVRVGGRSAKQKEGIWRAQVRLRRGRNHIEVEARAGTRRERRTIDVERGESADVVAAKLVRGSRGRLPDLRTETVQIAQIVAADLGVRVKVVPVVHGQVRADRWTVCRTRPFDGERLRRGERVKLFVAPMRLDRASGTDCRQDT